MKNSTPRHAYEVDLDDLTFRQLRIGDKLLRAEQNKELGYSIYASRGLVTGFFFCFEHGYHNFRQFTGPVTMNGGGVLPTDPEISSDSLREYFSVVPSMEFDDGQERCLEYRRNGIDIEFSWGKRLLEDREVWELTYLIVSLPENASKAEKPTADRL